MQNSKGRKRGNSDKPQAGRYKSEGRPSRGKKFGSSTDKSKEEFVKSGNSYSKNKFSGKRRFDADECGFERKRKNFGSDDNAGFEKRERPSRFKKEGGFEREKRSFKSSDSPRPYRKRDEGFDGEERPSRFKKEGGFEREKRSFKSSDSPRPYRKRDEGFDGEERPSRFKKEGGFEREKRSFKSSDSPRPYRKRDEGFDGEERPSRFKKEGGFEREKRSFKSSDSPRPYRKRDEGFEGDEKPRFKKRSDFGGSGKFDKSKSFKRRDDNVEGEDKPRRFSKSFDSDTREKRSYDRKERSSGRFDKPYRKKNDNRKYSKKEKESSEQLSDGLVRLNRYIANSGICSRREADELITAGLVSVNGEIVTTMGTKVSQDDVIKYNGETIRNEKPMYLLLNKPKDYITTMDDPQDRRTVMHLIAGACKERVYPVGRLDRNTTGVLLFTNDGDLAKKLTHPSYEVQKIYHVELDRNLKSSDKEKIKEGVMLDDGMATVDDIQYDGGFNDKKQIGVEIHSGKNRIVRRIFESMDYNVIKLDRVVFAGLTKKDIARGKWRFLSEMEVNALKMATSKVKPKDKEPRKRISRSK
ncbi:MAG: pseudouridine synthase [Bacteroidota bacterium]|nr:MAG: pseudouridine synthase [Bacteroidota bacterium]